jgi:WD40 repeat protein
MNPRISKSMTAVLVMLSFLSSVSAAQNRPNVRKIQDIHLNGPVQSLDVKVDGTIAAAALIGSFNKVEVVVFDPAQGSMLHTFSFDESDMVRRGHEPVRVRFTPDGSQLAVSFRSRVYFYDIKTFAEIRQAGVPGEDELHLPAPMKQIKPPVSSGRTPPTPEEIADEERWRREYIPEVKRIAKQGDGRLRITDFHFNQDGTKMLASYCFGECWMQKQTDRQVFWYSTGDDPVRMWNLEKNEVVWQKYYNPNEVVEQVTFSPDGKYFAAVSNNTLFAPVTIRSILTGDLIYTMPAYQSPMSPPEMAYIPSGSNQSMIMRWDERNNYDEVYGWQIEHMAGVFDVATGVRLSEMHDKDQILDLTLSPNMNFLLTYSWKKGKLKLWNMKSRRVITDFKPQGSEWSNRRVDILKFAGNERAIIANVEKGLVQVFDLYH